jgi:hypothetical protein
MKKTELKSIIIECLEEILKERCWKGYEPVPGKEPYSKGSCRKKQELSEEESGCIMFDNKAEALSYLNENPLKCVGWDDNQAIYWNGKVRIVKADSEHDWMNIKEGGRCTKPNTQKTSSTRKDKKWMKCSQGKRIHWGDPNAKVTGKSGNTKRKKSFRARHNCSSAKPGTPRHAACQDW